MTKWREYQKQAEPGTTFCFFKLYYVYWIKGLFVQKTICSRILALGLGRRGTLWTPSLLHSKRSKKDGRTSHHFSVLLLCLGAPENASRSLVSNGPTLELESSTFFESRKIKSTFIQAMWLKWNMVCKLYMFFFFFWWGINSWAATLSTQFLFFDFHSAEKFWK